MKTNEILEASTVEAGDEDNWQLYCSLRDTGVLPYYDEFAAPIPDSDKVFVEKGESAKPANAGTPTANGVAPLGKKRDVAKMLNVSPRTVDNYIAEGCPHIKPSPRCCRFDLADVKAWFKTQYGQQSRKGFAQN